MFKFFLDNLQYEVIGGFIVIFLTYYVLKPMKRKYVEKVHNKKYDDTREGFDGIADQLQNHCSKYKSKTIILRKLPFEFTRKYFDLLDLKDFDNKVYTDSIERVVKNGDLHGKGWWCWSIFWENWVRNFR